MMTIDSLDDLRRRLVDREDPSDLFMAFLNGLGSTRSFQERGRPTRQELIGKMIDRINVEAYRSRKRHKLIVRRIVEDAFVHGLVVMEGRVGSVFYFEDVAIGIAGFAPGVGDQSMTVFRFSGSADRDRGPRNRFAGRV